MGIFTRDIKTMDDLFVHTLRDIYYAEKQITKALPKMIAKETEGQVRRLEEVFRMHGHQPKGVTCESIDGIIAEAESVMGNVADKDVLDAAMIAAAQAVEHYEVSRYGTLAAWAKQLGRPDCANLLHQTLEEERRTDEKLSQIAETRVNRKAA